MSSITRTPQVRYVSLDAVMGLRQGWRLSDELLPAEQARIVRLLVKRIDLAPDGMQVRLRGEGLHKLVEELRLRKKAEAA